MKKLLISLMLIPFLASCGGQTKKAWKEISHEAAIKLEAQILNNFKAPKFYSSITEFKKNTQSIYQDEGEGFSEKKQFYRSIGMDPLGIDAHIYRVFENDLWHLSAEGYEKPKEEQIRHKSKHESIKPLDDLKTFILENYSKRIEEFENDIKDIDSGDLVGEYSFYSYDSKSLKGIVKYRKEPGAYDREKQIVFENGLPSFFLITNASSTEPENSTYGGITFNYSKQPTLPSDATPNDWCD